MLEPLKYEDSNAVTANNEANADQGDAIDEHLTAEELQMV
jgi:hypothetical protein